MRLSGVAPGLATRGRRDAVPEPQEHAHNAPTAVLGRGLCWEQSEGVEGCFLPEQLPGLTLATIH